MSMPLSKLIDNFSEGIHNNKCTDCNLARIILKLKTKS